MSAPSSRSADNGAGGDRFYVHGDLGGISEIQQQLSILSRQMGQLASHFTDSERQRTEEVANAAAMQTVQKAEKERRKGREVQEFNARMSSFHADHLHIHANTSMEILSTFPPHTNNGGGKREVQIKMSMVACKGSTC